MMRVLTKAAPWIAALAAIAVPIIVGAGIRDLGSIAVALGLGVIFHGCWELAGVVCQRWPR